MTTPRALITGALRLLNVVQANEVPTADDMDISFDALNGMIESWSTDRLSIFTINPYYFEFVPGQKEYTVGPGGDWNVERPMEIDSIYTRLLATTQSQPLIALIDPLNVTVDYALQTAGSGTYNQLYADNSSVSFGYLSTTSAYPMIDPVTDPLGNILGYGIPPQ